jgi:hypothetical protein
MLNRIKSKGLTGSDIVYVLSSACRKTAIHLSEKASQQKLQVNTTIEFCPHFSEPNGVVPTFSEPKCSFFS